MKPHRPLHRGAIALHRWHGEPSSGTAHPWLLLHGLGDCAAVWQGVAPALARHAPVWAADLPGHGRSDPAGPGAFVTQAAGAVQAAWAAVGGSRPLLVGHSLGAEVALALAPRIAAVGVVLVDPAPPLAEQLRQRLRDALQTPPQGYAGPAAAATALARRHPMADPELLRAYARAWLRREGGRWWPRTDGVLLRRLTGPGVDGTDEDPTPALAAARLPVLIVRGAWSWLLPQATARAWAAACRQGRLAIAPCAGHGVPLENPGFLGRELPGFRASVLGLSRLEGGESRPSAMPAPVSA